MRVGEKEFEEKEACFDKSVNNLEKEKERKVKRTKKSGSSSGCSNACTVNVGKKRMLTDSELEIIHELNEYFLSNGKSKGKATRRNEEISLIQKYPLHLPNIQSKHSSFITH